MKAVSIEAGLRPRTGALTAAIAEALRGMSSATRRARAKSFAPTVLAASGGAVLASALAMAPMNQAAAQEAVSLDEITVTGSRIRRQDFTANSPITTVDQTTFEDTSTVGVETVLNQLPQFVPAVTQFDTGDVQNSATNTVGASTVSLRGLGANRNLVLINGRRGQPVNATMVVDTNSIPSAAIQRVEVISGGASAVYGADAVGGVVNFILKDDFEGATIDTRYGTTQHGGGTELTVSGLVGANVADGRGNVMLGIERSERQKVRQTDRDWRMADLAHPNIGGTSAFLTETFVTNNDNFFNPISQEAMDTVFDQVDAGVMSPTQSLYVNPSVDGSGTVFTGGAGLFGLMGGNPEGAYRYDGPLEHPMMPGQPYRKIQPDGRIAENSLWQWASTPLDRYSAFGRGVFDISDSLRFTSQAMFTRTRTQTNLGLTVDAVNAHGAEIPHGDGLYEPSLSDPNDPNSATLPAFLEGGSYGLNCPEFGGCTNSQAFPLPPEVAYLMASRPDPNAPVIVNRSMTFLRDELGGRATNNQTSTFQLSMGLEGELPSGRHFWDASVSHGQTENVVNLAGVGRLESWRALAQSPNFGVNFVRQGNPEGQGFQAGFATCESGLPLFRDFEPSADCIEMLTATMHNTTQIEQNIVEANLVGTLAEMNAGPLQYALGGTWREASYQFQTDPLTVNQAFIEAAMGIFPTEDSGGDFDVSELYGELLVPIVSNGPTGVEHFNLELGARVSDFSTVGTLSTYKALVDWAITPRYRLRGGFNRAHRAPNLGELYLARTQVFGGTGSIFGDQCSQNNQDGPFSANPDANMDGAAGAQRTLELCEAMMTPEAAMQYYDRAIDDQPETGGTGLPNTTGNPNLREEQADTWTVGMVMDFLDNWTMTIDYFQIEITDMIAVESGDAVMERCLNPAFNPTANPEHPDCAAILRDPVDGSIATIDRSYTNEGRAKTSGIDVQLNWSDQFAFGGLSVNVLGSYNLDNVTQANPAQDSIDWSGTTGCDLQMQCMGYDFRKFTTISYFNGPYAVSLRWQHWPSIKSGAYATDPETESIGVPTSYNLFALSGNYRWGDRYTVRMGIENLFDTKPPRSGGNPNAEPFPTLGSRSGSGATYDPLGRRGFVSFTMDF